MIFELLRTHKVDVMRYLPQFLANDASFKLTQDTLSTEHENLRLTVIDIALSFLLKRQRGGSMIGSEFTISCLTIKAIYNPEGLRY